VKMPLLKESVYTGMHNSTTTLFRGINRSTRQRRIDAYAAMVCNNIYIYIYIYIFDKYIYIYICALLLLF